MSAGRSRDILGGKTVAAAEADAADDAGQE